MMRFVVALTLIRGSLFAEGSDLVDRPQWHEVRMVEGWKVMVDGRLLEEVNLALGEEALKVLQGQLAGIAKVVPEDKVRRLREVTIWLDLNCGKLTSMQYHPSAKWLEENGYDPVMEKAVHVPVAARLVEARHMVTQPWCVLHELAHAYHDQVLGVEEARVKAGWEKYVTEGRGARVLHVNGRTMRHYAMTNQKEFFAEMTEAYFGTNDFEPFVHGQMRRDEPEIYGLMVEVWGVGVLGESER